MFVRARACVCVFACMYVCVCVYSSLPLPSFPGFAKFVRWTLLKRARENKRKRTSVTIQRFFPTFCVRVFFFCISFLLLADFCEKSNSSSRIGRIYLASFAPFYAPIDRRLHYGWLMITVVDIDDTDKNIGKTNE